MVNKLIKKYDVTFTPKGTRSRFIHRSYDKKEDAIKKLNQIKRIPISKRTMLNPRVSLNPFYKKK